MAMESEWQVLLAVLEWTWVVVPEVELKVELVVRSLEVEFEEDFES
jgi:hypothetical protein